jgi:hypothetical protein
MIQEGGGDRINRTMYITVCCRMCSVSSLKCIHFVTFTGVIIIFRYIYIYIYRTGVVYVPVLVFFLACNVFISGYFFFPIKYCMFLFHEGV